MKISIIVAVAKNNVIGKDNQLLWHLPADLKHFKNTTFGHPVIMGRKTFESIGKPLPGRTCIVISRDATYQAEGIIVVQSITKALSEAEKCDTDEVFIIGGAQIYEQTLPIADKIYLTRIDASFEGDTFFPKFNLQEWKESVCQAFLPDEKNKYPYEFIDLERIIPKT